MDFGRNHFPFMRKKKTLEIYQIEIGQNFGILGGVLNPEIAFCYKYISRHNAGPN